MTEADGCALLLRAFTSKGLAIQERFAFREDGVEVELDGWDPARRVGYEYITTEAGDRFEFTADTIAKLEARMANGELYVLLVDEHDAEGEPALAAAAEGFLAELAKRGKLP